MAVWYEKLYVGRKAALVFDKIYQSVETGRFLPGIYLITLSANEREQLDLIDCVYLHAPAMKRRLMPVIGIAAGKKEAMELFRLIAAEVYEKTGSLWIRRYFEEKLRDESSGERTAYG